jgi:tetratricopeptide (TPR) repeat protein
MASLRRAVLVALALSAQVWCCLLVPAGAAGGGGAAPTKREISKLRSKADSEFVSGKRDGVKNALKLLNKVCKLEPDNHQNFYKRYRVYLRLKKQKRALRDLRKAVEIKPTFTAGWVNQGKLLLKMGQCEDAESALQQALSVDGAHKQARKQLVRPPQERLIVLRVEAMRLTGLFSLFFLLLFFSFRFFSFLYFFFFLFFASFLFFPFLFFSFLFSFLTFFFFLSTHDTNLTRYL